jgi:hypothetical protein
MMTAQKQAPAEPRQQHPEAVAGPFDFRLGVDADVDRIGVFFAGGRAWTRIC